jgi:hypothetical protein
MDDPRRIFATLCSATSVEARLFSAAISSACWPGGADRHQPSAAEWVRHWYPERAAAANRLPACACAAGHCAVCN